jgi:phage/plasmid-associated DNA primase
MEEVVAEVMKDGPAIYRHLVVNRLRPLLERKKFELPQSVKDERDEYRERIDNVAAFLGEYTVKANGDAKIPKKLLFDVYKGSLEEKGEGEYAVRDRVFYESVRAMGYPVQKEGKPRSVLGVAWKEDPVVAELVRRAEHV